MADISACLLQYVGPLCMNFTITFNIWTIKSSTGLPL